MIDRSIKNKHYCFCVPLKNNGFKMCDLYKTYIEVRYFDKYNIPLWGKDRPNNKLSYMSYTFSSK